jgi:hypothetical protein
MRGLFLKERWEMWRGDRSKNEREAPLKLIGKNQVNNLATKFEYMITRYNITNNKEVREACSQFPKQKRHS